MRKSTFATQPPFFPPFSPCSQVFHPPNLSAVQRSSCTQCAAALVGTERRLRRPHAAQLSLWNQGDDDSCYVVPTLFFDMTTDVFFMVRARARARCAQAWMGACVCVWVLFAVVFVGVSV